MTSDRIVPTNVLNTTFCSSLNLVIGFIESKDKFSKTFSCSMQCEFNEAKFCGRSGNSCESKVPPFNLMRLSCVSYCE